MTEKSDTPFVISDDLLTGQPPPQPPPGWVPPTISESLDEVLKDELADFYLVDDRPCAVWMDSDFATDYSVHPLREIHPFIVIRGTKIDRETFKARVAEIHGL